MYDNIKNNFLDFACFKSQIIFWFKNLNKMNIKLTSKFINSFNKISLKKYLDKIMY